MKTKIIHLLSVAFIALSGLSVLSVSLMAFADPQKIMNLVQVQLTNNDAYSSIRGVYGGVGITLVAALAFFSRKNLRSTLWFLALFWGMYAISRIITIYSEGSLGAFGKQWLIIELVFSAIALTMAYLQKPSGKAVVQ